MARCNRRDPSDWSPWLLDGLEQALEHGKPEIFNTDQGAQLTAHAFTSALKAAVIRISIGGRGRAFDNIFVERLWRMVLYVRATSARDIYIRDYPTVSGLIDGGVDHQSLRLSGGGDVFFDREVH
jgi:putative transposase